jgi:CubicO group peptidase (beta-lactamase class C family)
MLVLLAAYSAVLQTPSLATTLAQVQALLERRRVELGVPGAAFAIVKDGKIVLLKGFGLRDQERKLPVTPQTIFSVGSLTKSFTAMLTMKAVDERRLSLDDRPGKHLPYFRLADPQANAGVKVANLLDHTTGFRRTDLAWATDALSREELIRTVCGAKPAYSVGSRFAYQNVMYSALGEMLAHIYRQPYSALVSASIFKPLKMRRSNLSSAKSVADADHAIGYSPSTPHVPQSWDDDIPLQAAGSINSTAADMAKYLQAMIARGAPILSMKSYNDMTSAHVAARGDLSYGYGWYVGTWHGHKLVRHGGNVPGFASDMAFLPDEKLGYVLLTNVTDSPLTDESMDMILGSFFAQGAKPPQTDKAPPVKPLPEAAKRYAGTYKAEGLDSVFKVYLEGGRLMLAGTGQPTVQLLYDEGERFRMGPPAPADFTATFVTNGDNVDLRLEEGSARYVVHLVKATPQTLAPADLMKKVTTASGDAMLERRKSLRIAYDVIYENEGVTGKGLTTEHTPTTRENSVELYALGKHIGFIQHRYDGFEGYVEASWGKRRRISAGALANMAAASSFVRELNWQRLYSELTIMGTQAIDGEEAYVVQKIPKGGTPITDYYSSKSFLLKKREIGGNQSTTYSDYRQIDGVMFPFTIRHDDPQFGIITERVTQILFDSP